MIETKTVLVLGAGASEPYGFPTASELIEDVIHDIVKMGEKGQLSQIFLENGIITKFEDLRRFGEMLQRSTAYSIDAFLEHVESNEIMELGKAIIATELIQREKESNILGDIENRRWLDILFRRMKTEKDRLHENKITIVTFNYDRSIEYFLWNALQNSYLLDDEQTAHLISKIEIIHVHGQICKPHYIPFVDSSVDPKTCRPYAPNITAEVISQCSRQIRIVHQASENTEGFMKAKKAIEEAKIVCFLGFGYHLSNLRRLGIYKEKPARIDQMGGVITEHGKMYGTVYMLKGSKIQEIKQLFKHCGMPLISGNRRETIMRFLEERFVLS